MGDHKADVALLQAGDDVDEEHGAVLVDHLRGGEAAALGEDEVSRVHILVHALGKAQHPEISSGTAADDPIPQLFVGAADHHQPVIPGENLAQRLGELLHGACAHGAAGQKYHPPRLGKSQSAARLGLGNLG